MTSMSMRHALALALILAAGATSDLAAKPYEVVRVGDRDMACRPLADEINALTAKVADQQKRADRKQAGGGRSAGILGRGLASGLAYGASSMAYGISARDALTSAAAQGAAEGISGMASAPGSQSPPPPPQPAAPVNTPERQRLDHLSTIYKDKGC